MHNTQIINLGTPNPKQEQFLRATARHVAYGGARGGGKSWAVRTKAKLLALVHPGIRLLIIRRTYRELIHNHVSFLRPELRGIADYNKADKEFTFTNGSTVSLGYCAADDDLDQYQGAEFDVIFIDEAGQLRPEWLQKLNACVRGANAFPKRTYYTLNPGGPAHGYFKRLFIDRDFRPGEQPEDYVFIQAKVTDNAALLAAQPDYVRQLEALPPRLRRMWLEGCWDVYEGQFFQELRNDPDHYADRRWTHVIDPFPIPPDWRIYRSYDFGYARPFSAGWWAVDHDGCAYRILELYGCTGEPDQGVRWAPERQFREMARLEREHPRLRGRQILGVADPSIWDASRGESVAETAARCGIYFQRGDNRRLAGWMQVHCRLAFDQGGYPRLYAFRDCHAFLRTMAALQCDPRHPEDLDTTQEDHVADEVRYFCMARPVAPRIAGTRPERVFDPLG